MGQLLRAAAQAQEQEPLAAVGGNRGGGLRHEYRCNLAPVSGEARRRKGFQVFGGNGPNMRTTVVWMLFRSQAVLVIFASTAPAGF